MQEFPIRFNVHLHSLIKFLVAHSEDSQGSKGLQADVKADAQAEMSLLWAHA